MNSDNAWFVVKAIVSRSIRSWLPCIGELSDLDLQIWHPVSPNTSSRPSTDSSAQSSKASLAMPIPIYNSKEGQAFYAQDRAAHAAATNAAAHARILFLAEVAEERTAVVASALTDRLDCELFLLLHRMRNRILAALAHGREDEVVRLYERAAHNAVASALGQFRREQEVRRQAAAAAAMSFRAHRELPERPATPDR